MAYFNHIGVEVLNAVNKTFVNIRLKRESFFSLTLDGGYNDDAVMKLLDQIFEIDDIAIVQSVKPIQSFFVLRNPKGIVCIKNIEFNSSVLPQNVILLPLSVPFEKTTEEEFLTAVITKIFGSNHHGTWNENLSYTAIITGNQPAPFNSVSNGLFDEINTIIEFPFSQLQLDTLHRLESVFREAEYFKWWNLFFSVLDWSIDAQSEYELLPFKNVKRMVNCEWKSEAINQMRSCEICLTDKHDIGILFNQEQATVQYVSPMLVCFECYIADSRGIKDTSFVICKQWLPLFNSIIGLYLLERTGTCSALRNVILYLLEKPFLNKKELFFTEHLLSLFRVFNNDLTEHTFDLYIAHDGNQGQCISHHSTAGFVKRLTSTNGTLKYRLAHAYKYELPIDGNNNGDAGAGGE